MPSLKFKASNVLIIDDEPDICAVLEEAVRLVCRVPIYTAQDGEEGLSVLRQLSRPTLIILDLLMPNVNGYQFLERIKDEKTAESISVIVTTASMIKTKVNYSDHFILKPFDLESFLGIIKNSVEC